MSDLLDDSEVDELIAQTKMGDSRARERLLACYRPRLRRMITVRMDRRLAPRVDPSDIVQEALGDAVSHLDDYLRDRPLPFYPWLRRLAWEHLVQAHRRHIRARKRSVKCEAPRGQPLSGDSAASLAGRLVGVSTGAGSKLVRAEEHQRVLEAVHRLPERDRELLVLRYLEGLPIAEIAAVLRISVGAVMTRHTRALVRLRAQFDTDGAAEDET